MGNAVTFAAGILAGSTTKLTRAVTRRAMRDPNGTPRLPAAARRRNGVGTMLLWAVAVGVLLAVADILREQREAATPESDGSRVARSIACSAALQGRRLRG